MTAADWLLLSNNALMALDCLLTGLVLHQLRKHPPPQRLELDPDFTLRAPVNFNGQDVGHIDFRIKR